MVAEMIIETLVAAGVKRIYGVVGDSLKWPAGGNPQVQGH
jgi:thiamine pyrophosphate-dependent acetolactate synthase large subunit-like protein